MTQNRGPELVVVCSVFVAFTFVATALRVYVRSFVVKAFGWDDGCMVIALCAHVMFATCAISGAHYGTGRHMDTLTNEEIFMAMRYWWLCYIAYCWSMITSKMSIGLFLLRITVKTIHKYIIYTAMGLTVLTGLIFFLATLLQCTPIAFFWDKSINNGTCVKIDIIIGLTFTYSAISVICDFTFAILPFFLIWGLNMSRKSRIMLIPILGMACVASVAVVVRMAFVMDFKNPDFLWATVDVAIWSDVEQGLAITAGSLATLRPLWRQVSSSLGFAASGTPFGGSKPAGIRTPQWNGFSSSENCKKPGLFSLSNTLFRSENRTIRDNEQDYGLGDLAPIRLRDDLVPETTSDLSDKGFSTWTIQAGKVSDEDFRHGAITMQRDVYQETEKR